MSLKIFYALTQYVLPLELLNEEVFKQWMEVRPSWFLFPRSLDFLNCLNTIGVQRLHAPALARRRRGQRGLGRAARAHLVEGEEMGRAHCLEDI